MADLTLWHNPRCSKSRQAKQILDDRHTPYVERRYLEDGPSARELDAVLTALGKEPWEITRMGEDVAKELGLDWHTVKELDKQYMRAQLAKAGTPAPVVIGIDEVSIRKGHNYRIVVSDLVRERPIWFGGADRSEASLAEFYQWLGGKGGRLRLRRMGLRGSPGRS